MASEVEIKVPRRKLKGLLKDGEKSARLIDLVYVCDKDEGISRKKVRGKFQYFRNGKRVADPALLERIRKLVIPPAWENVWICAKENGHLQATGVDVRGRKQYRYHPSWNSFRNQTKFFQLLAFGEKLPCIREQLEKDLSKPGLGVEKVLAAIITIMQETSIRVGNNAYEKLYGSFGLTTLKDQHVTINGSKVRFCFKGKKGVFHEIDLESRRLARIVKQCRDIPGSELFQYYDDNDERRSVDSGMVNEYIRNICSEGFTTKDFRTWLGTVYAIEELSAIGPGETETQKKEKIVAAIDRVAARLGNTRAVCRKYYVHPAILTLYSEKKLEAFVSKPRAKSFSARLSDAECVLLTILAAA